MSCCAPVGTDDEIVENCCACGSEIDADGVSNEICEYSPVECELCGYAPCDQSC